MSEPARWHIPLSPDARAGFIHAYDGPVDAGSLHLDHPDPPYAAWLVRKGAVSVRFPDRSRKGAALTACAGEWLLLPARPRIHRMAPETHLLSVRFLLERDTALPSWKTCPPLILPRGSLRKMEAAAAVLARAAHRGDDTVFPFPDGLEQRRLFLVWLGRFFDAVAAGGWQAESQKAAPPAVRRALDWMEQRELSSPLRQEQTARIAGISVSHLKRLFLEYLGLSPAAWWQARRLREARRLLRRTEAPLKTVAADLAFRHPAHFSTWFRSQTGITPLAFRRRPTVDV